MSAPHGTSHWSHQDEPEGWDDPESWHYDYTNRRWVYDPTRDDSDTAGGFFADEGQVVTGVVADVCGEDVLVHLGLGTVGRIPLNELPVEAGRKPRQALSVGDEIEALVIDSRYGSPPVLSVALLQERLAWSEHRIEDGATSGGPDDRGPRGRARLSRPSGVAQSHESAPEVPDGERVVFTAVEHQLLDPVEFLQPNRRLFIDTNVFMDTDPRRAGGLKRLFERGQSVILANGSAVIVPTKVVGELTKQSRIDPTAETAERAEAIKKAGAALTFLESASKVGQTFNSLIRE